MQFASDEPKAGSGVAAAALAAQAREQLAAMGESGTRAPEIEAKRAYLSAAARLLETGESKGVGGTFLVAAGTMLMVDREAAFKWFDGRRMSVDALGLLASDMNALNEASASPEALDRALRNAFAELLQGLHAPAGAPSLWPWPEAADATIAAWPDVTGLGTDASSIDALRKRCELAETWIAYRPGGRAMARLIAEAAWPVGREKQVAAGVYRRWMSELAHASAEVGEASRGENGLARLMRLAALGRIFSLLDALSPDPQAKQLERALFAAVEVMPEEARETVGWVKLERWLQRAAQRTAFSDDKAVVRQLRPALRSISDLTRASQTEMLEALARVASNPQAAGDPGVIAAVNLFSDNIELMQVLHRASAALRDPAATGEPVARESARPFTDGLLKLAKEVADPKSRDRSIGALRNLATDVADLMELPGEKALREKAPDLEKLLGGKGAAALALIDRERLAWKRGVGAVMKPGATSGGDGNAARLRAIGIVLQLAIDVAECESLASDGNDPLDGWGGWWLGDGALAEQVARAAAALPALIESTETDLNANAAASARRGADDHAIIGLAARLSRGLAAAGPVPSAPAPLKGICAIATGSPDPRFVLLASWREQVAVVCRYAQSEEAAESKAFACVRAAEVIRAMERNEQ
ncbi:MAG: hypothetical protein J0L78_13440 [Planctomycetes bacterium]|nr:hypothetical protein [Planctomycetota bacterium]